MAPSNRFQQRTEARSLLSRAAFLRGAAALAAVGAAARPQAAQAAAPVFVVEIAPGVFVHQGQHALNSPENAGDISNAGFIVGRDAVAVIDTGGSARVGSALKAAIRAATNRPVRYVINTHMHPDHVFGNAAFADDDPAILAHHKMPRGLAARAERYLAINSGLIGDEAFAGTRIVPPTALIEDRRELDLGGRILILEAHPTAHTDNDLTVFDRATNTLFLGDLLFAGHVPTLDGSIRGWLALLDVLGARPAARVVPGHGPAAMPWPEGAAAERRYLTAVASEVRQMIKAGRTIDEASRTAARDEKDAWQLFDDYHARTVSAAFAELEWE